MQYANSRPPLKLKEHIGLMRFIKNRCGAFNGGCVRITRLFGTLGTAQVAIYRAHEVVYGMEGIIIHRSLFEGDLNLHGFDGFPRPVAQLVGADAKHRHVVRLCLSKSTIEPVALGERSVELSPAYTINE